MPPRISCALALLVFVLHALVAPARAATLAWQATAPANWSDPANWSAGAVPTSADTAQVNNAGQAQISVGAATASVLQLGTSAGDVGSLSVAGGQLTAATAYVGYAGTGYVLQTGGTLAGTTLYVAHGSKSAGSYTLQGPGTLTFSSEYIGNAGPASFTQAGGFNSTTNLYLANAGATYTLTDGKLVTGYTYVGSAGNATFTQSGGDHRVIGQPGGGLSPPGYLYVGYNTGASGTYNLLGNASLSTYYLYLGYNPGASGSFNLSGNASLSASYEYVGYSGPGSFVHTAGTNNAYHLYVGNTSAGSFSALGSYSIGDGALLAAQYVDVNYGAFRQSGGTVMLNVPGGPTSASLSLAAVNYSNATYSLNGAGALLSCSGTIHLAAGTGSTAAFTHSAGTVTTNGQPLYLAEGTYGSLATYTLSSGSLATGVQYIGHTGTGSFDQSGGTNRAGTLYLAYGSGSSAAYSLSAGTLFSANQYVGYAGTATLTHTGGTNDLGTATLALGANSANAKGVYLLTGPGAVLLAGVEDIGPGGASLFRQSAGSNATGSLTVRANSRYELSGGSVQVTNALTSSGTLDLLAGTVTTPSLVNNGTLTLAAPATLRAPASPAIASLTGIGSATVTAGATLRAGYLQQSALTVAGTVQLSSPATASTLSSLTLSPGSRLDLTTNTLRISTTTPGSTTASQVRQYLHDSLLLSSTADSDPLGFLTLGYLFDPVARTITIKTAPVGDANFDGNVTADDYALIDQGFARHLSFWSNGDFNYDGVVDQADYLLLDRATALRSGALAPDLLALRESQFGGAYVAELLVMIPEPSLMACFLAIPLGAGRRRRR